MPGPPGELITREKKHFREQNQKCPTYGHMTKLILESEFQHKRNKHMKNANSQQNLAVLSAARDSKNKII